VDFWDLTKLVFRRWYVAVPLLVITGLAAVYTMQTVKPDYKATAYVQLIPPPEASIAKDIKDLRNPWLDLGLGALNTAATYATVDKKFLDQLTTAGLSDNVVITNGYPAPIATVEVIGASKDIAASTADAVVRHFNDIVKSLQDDYAVQTPGRILTRRLDTGNNLEETGGKVKRALVAVVGAGGLITAGLTVAFDALMRRRARKRSRLDDVESAEPAPAATAVGTAGPPTAGPPTAGPPTVSPGERTVTLHVPNAAGARAVPVVNGGPRANGVARHADDLETASPDETIVLPQGVYGSKPGEGRGSKR
jgi:capsular polysaccharide biosynthesis protein